MPLRGGFLRVNSSPCTYCLPALTFSHGSRQGKGNNMDPAQELAWQVHGLTEWDECQRATSEILLKVFPAVGAGWVSFDAITLAATCTNFPQDYPSVSGDVFLRVYGDHPLVGSYLGSSRDDPGIRRISDLVTDLELKRTRTYQEAFRPLGIDRQFAMLTARADPASLRAWALVRSGKDFSDGELETAGNVQVILRVLDLAYKDSGRATPFQGAQFSLTAREQEVMDLLGRGLTATVIGHLLGVSPRTIAKHLEHVYAKLRCTNRIDALRTLRGDNMPTGAETSRWLDSRRFPPQTWRW